MTRVPAVNISESKDHYHLELAAPGLKKEDFKLALENGVSSTPGEGSVFSVFLPLAEVPGLV